MPSYFRLLTTLILITLSLPAMAVAEDLPDLAEARVEKIESGEVLVVKLAKSSKRVKVRVLGIDCTKSSKDVAAALVGRKNINLRSDKAFLPILQDQMGRYVAYVQTADGRDFGLEMLKSGQCSTEDWKIPHPKLTEYASASN